MSGDELRAVRMVDWIGTGGRALVVATVSCLLGHVGCASGEAEKQAVSEQAASTTRDAFSVIEAEDASVVTGAQIVTGVGANGASVGYLDDGDVLQYAKIDFGCVGASIFRVNLAVPPADAGKAIEVRLDRADGDLVGVLTTQPTGSYTTFAAQSVDIVETHGVHDLFLVMRGDRIANIDSLTFGSKPGSSSASASPAPAPAPGAKCERFQPGNYVYVNDNSLFGYDGLTQIDRILAADHQHVKGIGLRVNWISLEPSAGAYDFTKIDGALAKLRPLGKYLMIQIMDRSFHKYCDEGSAVGSFVQQESGAGAATAVKCSAKVWVASEMDKYIRLQQAIARRYKDDLHFIGFRGNELVPASPSLMNDYARTWPLLKANWLRMYTEVHAVAPTMMISSDFGWISKAEHNAIADALVALGGGGAISWPDTIVPSTTSNWQYIRDGALGSTYGWYTVGKERQSSLLLSPEVAMWSATPQTLDHYKDIYRYLSEDIGAQTIMWDLDSTMEILSPLFASFGGKLKNARCPYE